MSKSELILASVLISALLAGCEKSNDVIGDSTSNKVVEEGTVQNDIEVSEEKTIKLELVKELEGSQLITLSENRVFIVNGEKSAIYDENLNIVKEVGEVIVDISSRDRYRGLFIYQVPYFHDGEMEYKQGVMDLDGNILFEPILTSQDEGQIHSFIRDSGKSEKRFTYDDDYVIGWRKYENGNIELARIQTYPDGEGGKIVKVLDVLFEGDYEALLAEEMSGTVLGEHIEVSEEYHDVNSVIFKKNGLWGIIGLDGEVILNPEYGEVIFSHHNPEDGLDYYEVINSSGKKGIFNTKGWLIEPTFSYLDHVYMKGSYIMVDEVETSQTKVYNKQGELVKEFDPTPYLIDYVRNIFGVKMEYDSDIYLFDSDFNEINLPDEFYDNGSKVTVLIDGVISVRTPTRGNYLIDAKGNLITELDYQDPRSVYSLYDRYIVDHTVDNISVYEIVSE